MLKNRIIYLITLIYSVYLAILYDRYVSVLVVGVLLFVPLCGVICLLFWRFGTAFQLQCESDAITKGEAAKICITIKNRTIFSLNRGHFFFQCQHQLGKKEQRKIGISVDARSSESIELKMDCMHCGSVVVGCEKIYAYDYFGLCRVAIPVKFQKELLVIPAYKPDEEENEYVNSVYPEDTEIDSLGELSSEIKDLREYRPGDPIKRIHWKISSKKKKWMLKEYCAEEQERESLFFALLYEEEKPGYAWYDEKMDELVHASMTFLMEHRQHDVVWYHPMEECFHRTTIENTAGLWELVATVIRAGVQRMPEGFEVQLQHHFERQNGM